MQEGGGRRGYGERAERSIGCSGRPSGSGPKHVDVLLAEDCAGDGRYEFMVVSAPLNLEGGIASPPNAVVIK